MAEEFCRDNRSRAEAENQSRTEMEKALGSLKHEHLELTEKFKESEKRRKSAEASLKNAETQAKDQRQKLYVTETSLATEKQNVLELKAALQKAEDEMRRVKEEAQLIREAVEAEKKAHHQLGVQETRPGYPRRSPRCVGNTAAFHGLTPLMLQEFLRIRC